MKKVFSLLVVFALLFAGISAFAADAVTAEEIEEHAKAVLREAGYDAVDGLCASVSENKKGFTVCELTEEMTEAYFICVFDGEMNLAVMLDMNSGSMDLTEQEKSETCQNDPEKMAELLTRVSAYVDAVHPGLTKSMKDLQISMEWRNGNMAFIHLDYLGSEVSLTVMYEPAWRIESFSKGSNG